MFNVARVTFLQSHSRAGRPLGAPMDEAKDYEYRVPDHLKDVVKEGSVVAVSWRGNKGGGLNPTLARVQSVTDVLDGTFEDVADYAYVVGVVDMERFEETMNKQRRRDRLAEILRKEHERLAASIDLDRLAAASPELRAMVDEFRSL